MVYLIMAINVAVFAALAHATGAAEFSAGTLYHWGGDLGAVSLHGAYWRLVTGMFLHVGVQHLLGNMLLLWIAGRFVEARIGPVVFLGIYLVCGIVASVFSAWSHSQVVGVGASGAIAGVVGVVVVLYATGAVPGISGSWVAQTVGINAIYSLAPNVDWMAHLGGFLAGLACGGMLLARMRGRSV